jgi:O-antigen/teichoic acid export membrane protein
VGQGGGKGAGLMDYSVLKRNIWKNTVSNYALIAVGVPVGFITFGLLFQGLSREEFGFWGLMWSMFGYGVLLDLGFGFTAQKRVAELSATGDWDRLSRVLSTVFFLYIGIGTFVIVTACAGSSLLIKLFAITPGNVETFRHALMAFGVAIGIGFPCGIFPEMLRGQQRIWLLNLISMALVLIRLGLTWVAVHYKWGFINIVVMSLSLAMLPNVVSGFLAMRHLPQVRIRPGLFSRGMVVETMSYSLLAYVNTAALLLMARMDQLVLGTLLTVASVSIYQVGAKIAELFATFTQQLQETLAPAAAHLHAVGDRDSLRHLMINSTRWSVMIATPPFFLCLFYLESLMRLLSREKSISAEMWLVGAVMLVWLYTANMTHSVAKRVFMVCGRERIMAALSCAEALANLVLSVLLVLVFKNVICVVLGSLIPTLLFGWLFLWPRMARETYTRPFELFRTVVARTWASCLPMMALGLLLKLQPWWRSGGTVALMLAEGTVVGLAGAWGLWKFSLTNEERDRILARLQRFSRRKQEA